MRQWRAGGPAAIVTGAALAAFTPGEREATLPPLPADAGFRVAAA